MGPGVVLTRTMGIGEALAVIPGRASRREPGIHFTTALGAR
jgi:hypothetical protein